MTYATINDWLGEMEGHSVRGERVPPEALPWIIEAWRLGAASAVPQTAPSREKIIEIIGYRFGALVSGNNQPHMSGDPRARIVGTRRRHFDDACADCADEILALSRPHRGGA